jgi:hypothetical protein
MQTNGTTAPDLQARRKVAEARVKAALDLIQEAQMLLGRACAELSSVQGMNPSWREVGKRYDEVHGTWYSVERKAASVRARGWLLLDREPSPDELKSLEERRS